MDVGAFARDHWDRRPLLSRSAALPRDFTDLLTPRDVDELIAERGVRTPFLRMARDGALLGRDCYAGPAGFGAEMPDQVDSAKVLTQLAAGATVVLQGLHRLWPPIIEFARGMVDDLGHPVQANAYVTPAGGRGFDPHYDVHDVFVLQTAGRKHWTVHAPVHHHPLASQPWTDHRAAIDDRVLDEPLIDVVLQPGDALYLPRGWIHSATALGDSSIHLTVGVAAITGHDVLRALVDELGVVEHLRTSLPPGIDLTDPDETTAIVTKTMAALTAVLAERQSDLGEAVAARMTARHADRTRPAPVRPLATLDAMTTLDVDTEVIRRPGTIATVRRAGHRVELALPDRSISFPGFCAAAVAAVWAGSAVTAGGLPGLDTADSLVLSRRLLAEAVVVPLVERTG